MTLATRVLITTPTNPEKLHELITSALNPDDREVITDTEPGSIHNELGQGLGAILRTTYAIDGPLPAEDELYGAPVEHCIELWFDTAYGMREHAGIPASCDDLHAFVVTLVAATVGVDNILWYNEYAGEWHPGIEDLFGSPEAVEALANWFRRQQAAA